jgi:hypothetical protein
MLNTLYDASLDPFGGSFTKASDSPITDDLIESQMPGSEPRFEIGGVSIAAGSTKDFTFSVNPLSLGQHIEIGPVAPLEKSWVGIVWKTWVSALNELTVRLANVTDHSIKPALQGFFEVAGVTKVAKRSPAVQLELENLERQMKAHDGPPTKEETEKYLELKYGPNNTLTFSKHRGYVTVSGEQHVQDVHSQGKELQSLIEKYPYLKTAIDDGWAKVCIQEDGSLGLEFTHGHGGVHLAAFDEAMSNVSKYLPSDGVTKAELNARLTAALSSARGSGSVSNSHGFGF